MTILFLNTETNYLYARRAVLKKNQVPLVISHRVKSGRILHAVHVYMLPVWKLVYSWVTTFKGMLAVVTSTIRAVTMV